MAVTNPVFPPEIIEEIFRYLPVKTLGRSKCVSKQCRAIISNPLFIKDQFEISNRLHREKLIILYNYNDSLYTVDLVDLQNNTCSDLAATELWSLPPVKTLAGSFDGLITVISDNDTLMLLNTVTQEFMQAFTTKKGLLPKGHSVSAVEVIGFGYDLQSDDCKSVRIIHCNVKNGEGVRLVVVHSLRSDSWRTYIKPPKYRARTMKDVKAVYSNGCVHWLCKRRSNFFWFIASFNLQNEEFEEMALPSFVIDENVSVVKPLVVVSGYLCVVTIRFDCSAELWLMKEYRVRESWKKIPIYGLGTTTFEPLYLLDDREVVLKSDWARHELFVYNVEERTLREVRISGVPTMFDILGTCVESLISPKYGSRLEGGPEGLPPATIASSSSSGIASG